jgi:hypothetical protein
VKDDYVLKPHQVQLVEVQGNSGKNKEWLVEKNLMSNHNRSYLVLPNVLISSHSPTVPISNPSSHPWPIGKGEIIGCIVDPSDCFNRPKDATQLGKLKKAAEVLAPVVRTRMRANEIEESSQPDKCDLYQN